MIQSVTLFILTFKFYSVAKWYHTIMDRMGHSLFKPHLTIYLHCPAKIALEKIRHREANDVRTQPHFRWRHCNSPVQTRVSCFSPPLLLARTSTWSFWSKSKSDIRDGSMMTPSKHCIPCTIFSLATLTVKSSISKTEFLDFTAALEQKYVGVSCWFTDLRSVRSKVPKRKIK